MDFFMAKQLIGNFAPRPLQQAPTQWQGRAGQGKTLGAVSKWALAGGGGAPDHRAAVWPGNKPCQIAEPQFMSTSSGHLGYGLVSTFGIIYRKYVGVYRNIVELEKCMTSDDPSSLYNTATWLSFRQVLGRTVHLSLLLYATYWKRHVIFSLTNSNIYTMGHYIKMY